MSFGLSVSLDRVEGQAPPGPVTQVPFVEQIHGM